MKSSIRKNHPMIKIANASLVDLPTPSTISYLWNMGSLLGLCLALQIVSGIMISMHFATNSALAFSSVMHIMRDVNMGWIIRMIHMNGASLFFILIYIHISRGLFFSSFATKKMTWMSGTLILFILMATAFLGYVLPWGQMSFWGATVITNLMSAIPYLGKTLVEWVWGGFSVSNSTLNRFFSLHFLMPFVLAAMVIAHLMFLHQTGSSQTLGIPGNIDKISFHPFFSSKDILGMILVIMLTLSMIMTSPLMLGDPENFNPANPLVTPIHIQPEWYFLFAYAILRSIPNKLGGVIALVLSIAILMILPMSTTKILSSKFSIEKKITLWMIGGTFLTLTWIGGNPVEPPFETLGQLTSILYFLLFYPLMK